MASAPYPVETEDFETRPLCRLRVTEQEYDTKTVSLLATSHLFGLVFVGTPDRVVVIKVEDIIQIDEKIVSKKTEVSSFPHKAILLPSSPSFVSLSADNLTLMVCLTKSGCPVGWMYDVRAFARQSGEWNPFQEIRLSSTEGTTVTDCAWNPTMPGLVAVCLSDGSLVAVELDNTQFTINSLPASTGAQAISWSPKGKQLVVARPGKLVQHKPDLKEAKTIPISGADIKMNQSTVCGLQWLSTSQFLVTFVDESDPSVRPHVFIVNVQKSGPTTFLDYDDICFGNSGMARPHRYLTLGIPTWNLLLAASSTAMEIVLMEQFSAENAEHPEWRPIILSDSHRPELPMNQDDRKDQNDTGEETRPMGMALDVTSQTPLPLADNETLPPMPILFVLSTHGRLCPFHLLNLKKDAVMVNQPARAITNQNERPGMSGVKKAPAVPLAASTPLPATSKMAVPRTNLMAAFANTSTPSPAQPIQPVQPIAAPTPKPVVPPPVAIAPVKIVPTEVAKPTPTAPVKPAVEESSMGAAAAILRDEVAKFVQDLQDFKARAATLKVTVANDEDKQRLLKMTTDLSEFGVDLVDTTKSQDEDVRSLCTELVEVAALLEDARVRHARRKNSRYSHLLKLRPLDPSSRRKMDGIERLNAHIEQQLVEASRHLDAISRQHTRDQSRKIEIPITQVIYEAIKNNAKVISQLKSRVERIKVQSKEQQLKLAGAAFEALRPKTWDDSTKWESELAILADSLLTSRIRGEGDNPTTHPVIPQVSPEKQAMLRNVLAHRPVARIRAVRPESVAESRLLSNLSGLMHSERDNSSASQSSSMSKSGLFSSAPSPATKPQAPQPEVANNNGLATHQAATTKPESKTTTFKLPPASQVEDITPPSSPMNFDQKAKAIGNQPMISSLSLPAPIETVKPVEVKPVEVKPVAIQPIVSKPSSTVGLSFGSSNPSTMFSQSTFASAFAATSTATTTAPTKFSSFTSLATPASTAVTSQTAPSVSKSPLFGFATPSSTTPAVVGSSAGTAPFKSSFSFSSTTSSLPSVTVAASVTSQTSTAPSSTFSFAAPTSLPSSKPFSTPAATTAPSLSIISTPSASGAPTPAPSALTSAPIAPTLASSAPTLAPSAPILAPSAPTPASSAPTLAPSAPTPAAAVGSSTVTSAPPSFSFSLPKTTTASGSVPATQAPFKFNPAGNAAATSSAGTTPSIFAGALGSNPAAAPLFSLNTATKTPTAFGVVATPASTPSVPVFGQTSSAPVAATTGTTPALGSLFGTSTSGSSTGGLTSLFGQSSLAAAPSTTANLGAVGVTSSTVPNPTTAPSLFGSSGATSAASSTGSSLFSQAAPSSSSFGGPAFGGQSVFGQPVAPVSSSAAVNTPLFGQSTFGKPAVQTVPAVSTAPPAFGAAPVFGQPTGTTGLLAGSVFGQSATPAAASAANTATKPLFGASVFGQAPSNNAGQTAAGAAATPPATGFGSGLFGNMGLGGTPNPANANRNAFGGGTVFGSAAPSGQGSFGSPAPAFGSQPSGPVLSPPPSFGSPAGAGFGAFGQSPSQPAFGGAATFGGSPLFGSKPTFGGGPTFGSPVSTMAPPKQETGFGAFAAASNVPTFGVLANTGPSFETLANSGSTQQPAFGGAAFPSSNPPSFGGGNSFSSWR